jgi:hypothetical protein
VRLDAIGWRLSEILCKINFVVARIVHHDAGFAEFVAVLAMDLEVVDPSGLAVRPDREDCGLAVVGPKAFAKVEVSQRDEGRAVFGPEWVRRRADNHVAGFEFQLEEFMIVLVGERGKDYSARTGLDLGTGVDGGDFEEPVEAELLDVERKDRSDADAMEVEPLLGTEDLHRAVAAASSPSRRLDEPPRAVGFGELVVVLISIGVFGKYALPDEDVFDRASGEAGLRQNCDGPIRLSRFQRPLFCFQ